MLRSTHPMPPAMLHCMLCSKLCRMLLRLMQCSKLCPLLRSMLRPMLHLMPRAPLCSMPRLLRSMQCLMLCFVLCGRLCGMLCLIQRTHVLCVPVP